MWFGLVRFYDIATIVGWLIRILFNHINIFNSLTTFVHNIKKKR